MDTCPSLEQLTRLRRGEVAGAEQTTLLEHASRCRRCGSLLEYLASPTLTRAPVACSTELDGSDSVSVAPVSRYIRSTDPLPTPRFDDSRVTPRISGPDPSAIDPDSTIDPRSVDDPNATRANVVEESPGVERNVPRSTLPRIGEGFELLGELGRGGMGVVYKARQIGLNRLVALKMLRDSHADHDMLERFRREAEVVARIRHANIVQIFEIGAHQRRPFVSFELLEGGTLTSKLAARPFTGREAAELLSKLATAMHVAHREGVVHRDLKPSNVLFTHDGIPKIADFGLAKNIEAEDGHTRTGQIMGTPSYMAPEQADGQGHKVGPPADIYALGAILYESLTGRPPFRGPTTLETVRQVIETEPLAPSRLQPNVPRDLETICLKCLQKDPRRRYPSAQELADDLRRYLAAEPVRARRTPLWERGVKWARRHPTAATLLALGLTATVAAGTAWQRIETRRTETARAEVDRVARLRENVQLEIAKGQRALDQQRWGDARVILGTEWNRMTGETRLRDLRSLVGELLKQADAGLASTDARARAEAALAAHRAKVSRFLEHRDKALYHATGLTGLTPAENDRALRESATAALALFEPPPGSEAPLAVPPEGVSDAEVAELRERHFELLLILSQVTENPAQGLTTLDRAARLGPALSRAYHSRRASCLERAGDVEAAARERAAGEAVQPSSAFDYFLTGLDQYKTGAFGEATRRFDAAIRLQPDHFWAQCLSALCDLQRGRPSEAKVGLTACLTQRNDLAVLHVLRGLASCTLAERAPGSAAEQLDDAEADFRVAGELLDARPDAELRYAFLVNRGTLWFLRQRWDRATADLTEAIGLHPERPQAYATLAQVQQRRGRPDLALETYTRAVSARPRDPAVHRARAQVVVDMKAAATADQRAAALADLDQAMALEPPRAPVLAIDGTNRARLLDRDGRAGEALAACDAALAVTPEGAARQRLETQLVKLAILSRLERFDDVIRACDEAIATGLASPKLLELRALARSFRHDFPAAIDDLTRAITLAPDAERPPLLARRGELYLMTEATRLALRDFDDALRMNSSLVEAHAGRGLVLALQGDPDAAAQAAEEVVRVGEDQSPTPPFLAARILAQTASSVLDPPRRPGALEKATRFQHRARALLGLALERVPSTDRSAFARRRIDPDPLLRRLIGGTRPPS